MEVTKIQTENWLTQKPKGSAFGWTLLFTIFLFWGGFVYLDGIFNSDAWMPASGKMVFENHQYWRLWTSLFSHADAGHILGNAFIFVPFTFFLTSYFSPLFFPIAGIALGGLINLIVLKTMPPEVTLIGMSGVCYWMGAAWLTLFILVDRRENLKRRFARALFITAMLFLPQAYKPEISYLSHAMGFILGIASALFYYQLSKSKFKKMESYRYECDEEPCTVAATS